MFSYLCKNVCYLFNNSCSSNADEDEIDDPSNKAVREKERRQANNVRERYVNQNHIPQNSTPILF